MKRSHSSIARCPSGRLRLLETTDLHMQLLDYDYFGDRHDPTIGLIGLADQIAILRNDPLVTTILCDNGDLIQGNPLADYLAQSLRPEQTHPMIAALNMLGYDAMALGNHEFDYGVESLRAVLAKADFKVVCANITPVAGEAFATPFVVLDRDILCDDGTHRTIKIGITGFAPPQFEDWTSDKSHAGVRADDIIDAARMVVPQIKAAGADVIVALCHSGIGAADYAPRMENAAVPLAQVAGIDVLLMGHTHEMFPDPTLPATASVDYQHGSLHGKPATMAGFCGQSFGVIDLVLDWQSHGWHIVGHQVQLVKAQSPNGAESKLRKNLRALAAEPHAATIAQMQEPIARTVVPITSYFATVQPDLSQQLLAQAMQRAVNAALGDTPCPVLAAKSSFRFGGRSGLGHYIDIAEGPITLRDAAAIFPFADALCAVRRTGKQLRLWLERAVAHYNQMHPGEQDQPLINAQSAAYNCDAIYGLSYLIDLTQPARFDAHGCEIDPHATRIVQMTYQGTTVRDDDIFIVATNSFRAKGGGGFPKIAQEDIIHTSQQSLRDILIADLKAAGTVGEKVQPTWRFAPIPNTAAIFASAPQAQDHISGPISHIGPDANGFARYRIRF
ncbi:bifunctional 2',3'-cyclic-nucleotide 2'-phosphodiesterase/3'-nucleotidase [Yoonia algicola]|uniref:Bifunctional 2',3'-cyclic-nucleotide 2'-phosphodiesterase/3'-nucleotidase n=1 Tax=Yoonia algicola TaxID=3137368 RepID=A0AAN0LZE4_9RHOB